MTLGGFTFVLHSHMPFYRGAGRWPHGEEALHEVMAETYVPLLEALTDLLEEGIKAKVTLGITPILAEQLADPLVIGHFEEYVQQEIEAATAEIRRFQESGEQHFLYLAHYYLDWYQHVLQTFQQRFGRDLIAGFRRLQDAGAIEILTSASTHPYLPLMSRDSTVYANLEIGKRTTQRHFGKSPRAIWLPECAYRPGYWVAASDKIEYARPGIEEWLERAGLRLFFSESSAVEGSPVLGKPQRTTRELTRHVVRSRVPDVERSRSTEHADGQGQGHGLAGDLYGDLEQQLEEMGYEHAGFVTERSIIPVQGAGEPAALEGGTFNAYYVRNSDVVVMGRNRVVGEKVWSAMFGYPGEGDYREFHKKDAQHGFQYWRVTDSSTDLQYKQPYDPYWAGHRVQGHADHFVGLLEEQLRSFAESSGGRPGFIASSYDTELFGHWWFEGVQWLKEVVKRLVARGTIEMCTASEWLQQHPPEKAIDLPESSWGHGGTHVTWINPDTAWMWDAVHVVERRMEGLVDRYPVANELEGALNQAAREVVLLEASDWEFLYTTGQARQYATDRFVEHVTRFNDLATALEEGNAVTANRLAQEYGERDNPFPDMDYRLFARRQPD